MSAVSPPPHRVNVSPGMVAGSMPEPYRGLLSRGVTLTHGGIVFLAVLHRVRAYRVFRFGFGLGGTVREWVPTRLAFNSGNHLVYSFHVSLSQVLNVYVYFTIGI